MKIQCKLIREGGTIAEIGGKEYHFAPQADGAHVADVAYDAHIERFLSIPEAYKIYRSKGEKVEESTPKKAEKVETKTEKVEKTEVVGLIGSSVHPESFEINGKTYTLGEVVNMAFEESGMDAEEWNGLSEESRHARIDETLDNIAGADADPTIEELRAAYKEKCGKNPHPSAKVETLKAKLAEGIE